MAVNYASNCETDYSSTEVLFADSSVKEYIKKISIFKTMTAEEEQECAKEIDNGSLEAKQKMTQANLKLVVAIARKVIHTSKLPMIDLIQEGNIGLMVAVDKFNRKFGYRFATYASWWIKQSMFKAISEQSHSVKIPVYIQETLSRYSKLKSEMEKNAKTSVAPEDVAAKMNIDSNRINNYINAYKKTLSLECDFEMQNGSEVKLMDIISDNKESADESVEYESLQKGIYGIISCLKEREQKVITLRFGLDGNEKQTLENIGKIYGVTKECIRQTEARALAKLKSNGLSFDLYENYVI